MGIYPTSSVNLELPPGVDVLSPLAPTAAAEDEGVLLREALGRLSAGNLDAHTLALLSVTAAEAALRANGGEGQLEGERLELVLWLEGLVASRRLSPLAAATLAKRLAGSLLSKVREEAAPAAPAGALHLRTVARGQATPSKRGARGGF
jgi:hypothetical protein